MREQVPSFPDRWLIEDYGGDWFGLRFAEDVSVEHDGRGVPEGTRRQWEGLISAMRECRIGDVSDRLAFVPATRHSPAYIHSPRNTHEGEEFYVDDPEAVADWIERMLAATTSPPPKSFTESTPDNLRHVANFIIAYAALLEQFPGFTIDHAESAPTLVTPYGFGLSDFDRDEVVYLAGELKKKGFTDWHHRPTPLTVPLYFC